MWPDLELLSNNNPENDPQNISSSDSKVSSTEKTGEESDGDTVCGSHGSMPDVKEEDGPTRSPFLACLEKLPHDVMSTLFAPLLIYHDVASLRLLSREWAMSPQIQSMFSGFLRKEFSSYCGIPNHMNRVFPSQEAALILRFSNLS